jgi:N-acetylmuramoyl-L-alanine amidase CwlA
MNIVQNFVSPSKYNIKCPYPMVAEFIVVHNTANDASAANEVSYMIGNNNQVSFHYAIDDKEIVQGIPENRNAWHAGDGASGKGNRKGLSIEICYSKSGGKRFEEAEKLAAKFIAYKLYEKGWGIDKVKKHQDFSGKYCPHRTLDMGWQRFLDMVQSELNALKGADKVGEDKTQPSAWAKEPWDWAKKEGITDGTRPKDTMTREEMVTMLHRYHKKVAQK